MKTNKGLIFIEENPSLDTETVEAILNSMKTELIKCTRVSWERSELKRLKCIKEQKNDKINK